MADDKRQKKRGRNKVFRSCFRSFAAGKANNKSDGLDTNNGRLGNPVLIAEISRTGKEIFPDGKLVNGCDADRGRRRSPRRKIPHVLKAVLFDSIMKKKVRRSSSKSSIASDTSASSSLLSEKTGKLSDDCNAYGKECSDMDDSCSRSYLLSSSSRNTLSSSSSFSSSSINSSSQLDSSVDFKHPISSKSSSLKKSNPSNNNSSSSRSCFDQKLSSSGTDSHLRRQDSSISLPLAKPIPINSIPKLSSYQKLDSRNSIPSNPASVTKSKSNKNKSGGKNGSLRWCLFLLLSLVVLVIWGRLFSILCTSISFYFVPCRRIKRVNSVTNAVDFIDFDSEQYKKRVIMAGFLERTRNPLR